MPRLQTSGLELDSHNDTREQVGDSVHAMGHGDAHPGSTRRKHRRMATTFKGPLTFKKGSKRFSSSTP